MDAYDSREGRGRGRRRGMDGRRKNMAMYTIPERLLLVPPHQGTGSTCQVLQLLLP